MGVYRTVCYKVEDVFVKFLARNKDQAIIQTKVATYRNQKELKDQERKAEKDKQLAEERQIQQQKREAEVKRRRELEEKERREIEALLSRVMQQGYSQYEYNEISRNKQFFSALTQRVFESNEKALAFIYCEYDKSSKKEIKGYLIPTNKRVLFLTRDLTFMDKFRYQTVINVNWFKDGLLERGLKIQYGKRRLEFDEMFDQAQMERVGNIILNHATHKVYM
ncbi:hypothetical protein AM500_03065 [Bacillus sp. FJAT-18017]|uniref:PH domain-containing protein n=1 Tax=Bacillus sp. FJAT-18017 TaxID=1705566 RepID=UPI0006B00304|nr:PH domain-containing protein [Bacillus sp. FJAT-18017]ALC88893.1 hypothetical protein AM500_03065 [Bacillus sp. FJAT-18017]